MLDTEGVSRNIYTMHKKSKKNNKEHNTQYHTWKQNSLVPSWVQRQYRHTRKQHYTVARY